MTHLKDPFLWQFHPWNGKKWGWSNRCSRKLRGVSFALLSDSSTFVITSTLEKRVARDLGTANSIGLWRESIFTSSSCNGDKYGGNNVSNDDPWRRVLLVTGLVVRSLLLEEGREKYAEPDVCAAENRSWAVEEWMVTGNISARSCTGGCDELEWRLHKSTKRKAHPTRQTCSSGVSILYPIPSPLYKWHAFPQSVSDSASCSTTIELVGVRGVKRL